MANRNNKLNKLRILQWNLQGLRAKQTDLKSILSHQAITVACLQETLLEDHKWNPPRNFCLERGPFIAGESYRGTALLIHKSIPYKRININTTLEAVAVSIQSTRRYTICCLYMSPNRNIRKEDIMEIIEQLPKPFLILGDFNAKHPHWDKLNPADQRGKMLEKLLIEEPICLYNEEAPTHYHIQTGTSSTIDLSVGSSDTISDFRWQIDDDLHSSDHYPIYVTAEEYAPRQDVPRWQMKKANWETFSNLREVS